MTVVEIDRNALDDLMRDHDVHSDAELARSLGVTKGYISQLRSGVRAPSVLFVTRMLDEFGVPFHPGAEGGLYLLGDEEKQYRIERDKEDLL